MKVFFLSLGLFSACAAVALAENPPALTAFSHKFVGKERRVLARVAKGSGKNCWYQGNISWSSLERTSTLQDLLPRIKTLPAVNKKVTRLSSLAGELEKSKAWKGALSYSSELTLSGIQNGDACLLILSENMLTFAKNRPTCTILAAKFPKTKKIELSEKSSTKAKGIEKLPTDIFWDLMFDLEDSVKASQGTENCPGEVFQ